MKGIIGKKVGMTRIFEKESGQIIPVTVVEATANIVQQIKTLETDGYRAAQLGYQRVAERKATKALLGHCKKHESDPTRITKEFKFDSDDEQLQSGQKIGIEVFTGQKYLDVIGTTKGRGFSGTIKRHNFKRGRMTHGNTNRREAGSIGSNTFPSHVFPGKRMSGHYGNEQVTIRGLKIVELRKEEGIILLKGAIPGPNRGIVYLMKNTYKF